MQSNQHRLMEAPAVVLIDPKYPHNVGAAIRACSCFDVRSLVWTGDRVNPAKYERLPREERMKGYKRVDFRNHQKPVWIVCGIEDRCGQISGSGSSWVNSVANATSPVTVLYCL